MPNWCFTDIAFISKKRKNDEELKCLYGNLTVVLANELIVQGGA